MDWEGKIVLITGGTGSFGQAFCKLLLNDYPVKAVRVYSRDELKQYEMARKLTDPRLRFLIGDVRDKERLERAMIDVDIVVHAAALKQILACEYNPLEAIKTNIMGAANVIEAALNSGVKNVIALSSDKAVNPVNLYGATKLCAEKLFVQGNSYSGAGPTRFSCARYGNVLGSRGSVVPLFYQQKQNGMLTITDSRMTRFWITLPQAVKFVIKRIESMQGGEIFVPKLPSVKVTDLAETIAPGCTTVETGIRPGEKLHEVLVTEEESRHSRDMGEYYLIEPENQWWDVVGWEGGVRVDDDFRYSSDSNERFISGPELVDLIKETEEYWLTPSAVP
ncbi:MAG: polysaccharide biosynthesis protein CapD [Dehalococcoidia bacterium]|nr:polysaccharide biosynthesis protein CapD [Dehalococcoidia bacterium]